MICISIGKQELFPAVNALKPDLVEVRYDLLAMQPEEVSNLLNDGIRQIATCRPGIVSEQERFDLLQRAIKLKAAYVDLELESDSDFIDGIKNHALAEDCSLIVSYHNFECTPGREELLRIEESCYENGADVAKLACMVADSSDNAKLLSLYDDSRRKVIIGMGEKGRITRLAAETLGAEFTFVSVSDRDNTAPGQLSYNTYLAFKKKTEM